MCCCCCCECRRKICLSFPLLAILALITSIFFSYLSADDVIGVFDHTVDELSDLYGFKITPANWTFFIWNVIFAYQGLWLIYGLTLFWRRNPVTERRLDHSPTFMPPWIYITMIVNLSCNTAWIFIWDAEELWLSAGALCLVTGTAYLAIGISFYYLRKRKKIMSVQNLKKDIVFVIGLVHNGLGTYATWVTLATLLNVGIALVHSEPYLEQDTASYTILGVISAEVLAWIVLDNTFLKHYTTYLFTPYLVIMWTLVGIVYKIWDFDEPVFLFAGSILILSAVGAFAKVVVVILGNSKKRDKMIVPMTRNDIGAIISDLNANRDKDRHLLTEQI